MRRLYTNVEMFLNKRYPAACTFQGSQPHKNKSPEHLPIHEDSFSEYQNFVNESHPIDWK